MRLLTLFLLVILLPLFGNAQKITIYSASSNMPIPNVAVHNKDKSRSAITDFDGVVDISAFSDTEMLYFAHVSHMGLQRLKSKVIKSHFLYLEPDENQLSEVIISVSKWKQEQKEITQKIVSISSNEIALSTPQTSADLLQNSGQVFVQKSQLGGGSPIIRGFSTNRLLLTVDGVRMNTAIFRGGNVQNVLSVDPFTIDRTEVILGPGSVVYGSDAIGGVMNFYTVQPKLSSEKEKHVYNSNALVRYASASNEKTGHIDFNFGSKKWAFLTSVSYTDFDDLKMGSHGPDNYLRNEYVRTVNGEDVIVQNDDPKKQVFTGYNQINALQKIYFKPNGNWDFNVSLIYTETSDYPRYDRLIRRKKGNLRSAEWFYGPQRWLMGNFQVSQKSRSILYDEMKITAAYQYFEESRNDRGFGSAILSKTKEQVDAYSFNWDFEKKLNDKTTLYYGLEYVLNQVYSNGSELNIDTNSIEDAPSRYPNESTWQSIAVYTSLKRKLNEKLRFQGGLRYNRVILYSTFDTKFFDFPFTEANIDTESVTGTAGLSWFPNTMIQWKLNFSTAFRAPNIDDVGKIFDSEPGSVVVPNPDIKSEYAYNGELGVQLNLDTNLSLDLSTYYTYLNDALIRRDFNLDGVTEIEFGGELSNVQAIQNAANAKIYGLEVGLQYKFAKNFKVNSQYTFVGGKEEDDKGNLEPSRHVSPQFGTTKVSYILPKLTVDAFAVYNGKLDYENLSSSEQNKSFLYATDKKGNPYSPSWYTFNLRTQYQFAKSLKAIVSIENITDQRYRSYSSGITGAGRNFIVSLKYTL
ncbi:TonB-dependent receptor [Aquimarina longa]|uniref:TonB-dependent receptor n=1 Tax=Aquimarina longa TaxID=1080221 RepID=UPI0007837E01|nr:TonB-dependent receptor [Aquimarina longa]